MNNGGLISGHSPEFLCYSPGRSWFCGLPSLTQIGTHLFIEIKRLEHDARCSPLLRGVQ
jgi:hypothetical protein